MGRICRMFRCPHTTYSERIPWISLSEPPSREPFVCSFQAPWTVELRCSIAHEPWEVCPSSTCPSKETGHEADCSTTSPPPPPGRMSHLQVFRAPSSPLPAGASAALMNLFVTLASPVEGYLSISNPGTP